MPSTTHLVCAPDDLASPAVVMEWLVPTGGEVLADAPLVRLVVAGATRLVLTPMAGVLTEHCVAIGEPLAASDLLAMIEAEEAEFDLALFTPRDTLDVLAVPACRQGTFRQTAPQTEDAFALCVALGVTPGDVIARGQQLTRDDVEQHVRRELRTLATLRDLLQR